MDCLFCAIGRGDIPATVVDQNDDVVAFRDINPEAPVHVLVIPRQHHATIESLTADARLTAELMSMAAKIGASEGTNGHRIVLNTGEHGGQTVHHVHAHVLAGRNLQWPPG